MKIERTIKVTIDREDVVNLLTMQDGGFDYWCCITYKDSDYCKAKGEMVTNNVKGMFDNGYCYEEVLAYMICDTNYKVYAYDYEEEKRYLLTKEILEKGFQLNAENRPNDADLDEGDAETGDCILQYAVFGDIIYG